MRVHQSYGRLGLGNMLVKISLEMAQSYGTGAVIVYAFSECGAKIAAGHG